MIFLQKRGGGKVNDEKKMLRLLHNVSPSDVVLSSQTCLSDQLLVYKIHEQTLSIHMVASSKLDKKSYNWWEIKNI